MPLDLPNGRRAPSNPPLRPSALLCALISATALVTACGGGDPASDGNARATTMAAAKVSEGGVMINEVSTANWQGAVDEDGDAEDWVELYNPAATEVDLSGYGLSNKSASPFYWSFPAGTKIGAKAYLRVWLSKKDRTTNSAALHANFNLDNGADTLYLTASNATAAGIQVDMATAPLLKEDVTWCRMPNGDAGAPFQVCAAPTPGAANSGVAYTQMMASPTVSVASGLYAGAQSVTLSGPAGATIRYTLDGSVPTEASPVYTGPITISSSSSLRASAFADGALPSLPVTASYAIDAALAAKYGPLKAVFVTLSPNDLTRYQARDDAWRTRVPVEMVSNGTQVFKIDAEGSVAGQIGSTSVPEVPMNLSAKDALGYKSFPAALWPEKPLIKSTKKIRLRNSGNDGKYAHLRDQLAQNLGSPGPNVDASSTSVLMFVNGQYYGVMDLREREDETFVADNLGIDKDYVQFINDPKLGREEIKNGGAAARASYYAMHNHVTGNDMSVASNYAKAATMLDPASLAWDWGMHLFLANSDWPHNNIHVWNSPEVDGRWKWHAHDMDFAFGIYSSANENMNFAFDPTHSGSEVFTALLKAPEFRNLFLNSVADQMNVLSPTVINTRLNVMAAEIQPYMGDYFTRKDLGSEATWRAYVNAIRTFVRDREPVYDEHMRTQFGLGHRGAVGVSVNDTAMGTVKINGVDIGKQMSADAPGWSGKYYPGIPLSLEAKPKPGYTFVGWQGASTATARTVSHTVPASTAVNADNFSVRWTGQVKAPTAGTYRFQTLSDDGVRVRVGGQTVIDNWTAHSETSNVSTDVTLTAGQRIDLAVDYFEATGGSAMRLMWLTPGAVDYVPVPTSVLYPDASATAPVGLTGNYFNNTTLSGTAVAQAIEGIDFRWGTTAPTPSAAQFRAVFAPAGTPAAPVIDTVAAQSARTGDIVNVPVPAVDPGGFDPTWSAKTLPKGLNINASNGRIYGRITTPGTYASKITVTNGVSSSTYTLNWTVTDRPGTGLLGTSADSGNNTPPVNQAPIVSLTAPANGATALAGTSVTFTASAADSDGSIARVEFYDWGNLMGTSTTAPYSTTMNVTSGVHSLTVKAVDNLGASTTSAATEFTVTPAGTTVLPTGAVVCAKEGTTCALPANTMATVYYGIRSSYFAKAALTGNVSCDTATFGDPLSGVAKQCAYVVTSSGNTGGLRGEYYTNADFLGTPVITRTEAPTLNLGVGGSPGAGLPTSLFGVRWSGSITSAVTGTHTFRTTSSTADGVRLWVGGQLVIDNWVKPSAIRDATVTLTAGQALPIRMEFFDAGGAASVALSWKLPSATTFTTPPNSSMSPIGTGGAGSGLTGEYYATHNLSGSVVLKRTEAIYFSWGLASPDAATLPVDNFSARWTGFVVPPSTGSYQFQTKSDDGVRVWVDGKLIIDNWTGHAPTVDTSAAVTLTGGQRYAVKVEYQDYTSSAMMRLLWLVPNSTAFAAVPASVLYPN